MFNKIHFHHLHTDYFARRRNRSFFESLHHSPPPECLGQIMSFNNDDLLHEWFLPSFYFLYYFRNHFQTISPSDVPPFRSSATVTLEIIVIKRFFELPKLWFFHNLGTVSILPCCFNLWISIPRFNCFR